jgi:hypothetical protein
MAAGYAVQQYESKLMAGEAADSRTQETSTESKT